MLININRWDFKRKCYRKFNVQLYTVHITLASVEVECAIQPCAISYNMFTYSPYTYRTKNQTYASYMS